MSRFVEVKSVKRPTWIKLSWARRVVMRALFYRRRAQALEVAAAEYMNGLAARGEYFKDEANALEDLL